MNRRSTVLTVSFLGLALVACGIHVDYTPLNASPHLTHARLPEEVAVFDGTEPPRRYVEIGTIDARQQSARSVSDKNEIIEAMRPLAARQGCDGVKIIGRVDIVRRIGYRAACIVYIEDAPAAASSETAPAAQSARDGGVPQQTTSAEVPAARP